MELQVATAHGKVSSYAYTGGKVFDASSALRRLHSRRVARPQRLDAAGALVRPPWPRVLAVDQPGHGRSGGAPLADVEALADWTLALLSAAGVERAALVGHSMGSLIALEAAARAPERVTQLVMVGTAVPMKVSDALLTTARDDPNRAIDMVTAFSHASLGPKPSYPGPGAWVQRRLSRADAPRAGGPARPEPVPPRLHAVRPLRQRAAGGRPGALPGESDPG